MLHSVILPQKAYRSDKSKVLQLGQNSNKPIYHFFYSSLLDCMVLPLQDKLEEWRKTVTMLDKEHAKEYKKLR